MSWYVYILECADGTLYTGATNDLERRVKEHNESPLAAKYTRARRPVVLKYSVECADRSEALKEEARIKGIGKAGKMALVDTLNGSKTCQEHSPTPRIVAFGDSLVYGYGSDIPGGFVSILSKSLNVPIVNLGKNGDTTASAKARVNTVIDASPEITLVLLGGNDALQRLSLADTESNLSTVTEELQKSGSRVVLIGVIGGFPDPYASMYARLAKKYDVTYVPNILSGILGRSEFMSDPIHPNQAGYQKIADRLLPVLEEECDELSTE